jgi:hypothetical protein
MFYAIKQWKPYGAMKGNINFNNYISLRILAGLSVLDNDSKPGKDVQLFFEQRGLLKPQ